MSAFKKSETKTFLIAYNFAANGIKWISSYTDTSTHEHTRAQSIYKYLKFVSFIVD